MLPTLAHMTLGEGIIRVLRVPVRRELVRRPSCRRATTALLLALATTMAACDGTTEPIQGAPPTREAPSAPRTLRMTAVDPRANAETPIDVWMGTAPGDLVRVHVTDADGAVRAARVRFRVVAGDRKQAVEPLMNMQVDTDSAGMASLGRWLLPVRDTVAALYRVEAELVDGPLSVSPVVIALRAWRDLRTVGDASPLVFTALPIAQHAIATIRPMGTFMHGDALPSADAIIVPTSAASHRVDAMASGVITEVDQRAGAVVMRVRDEVRVRLAGFTLRHDLWVGQRLSSGDSLGVLSAAADSTGLRVRVLDATIADAASASSSVRPIGVRPSWIRPERYGARVTATFFARYLSDALRSAVYARVRRAAPDLDGRIGYDQRGRLVGTWFDPSAPVVANVAPAWAGPSSLPLSMDFSAAIGNVQTFSTHRVGDIDPSDALGQVAMTFVYDAERPGQVRIAAGEALARALGLDAVHAVAWEDPDPALVDEARGTAQYHLYGSDDEVRIGRPLRVLLVQMVGSDRLRVEVVPVERAATAAFSERAIELVR